MSAPTSVPTIEPRPPNRLVPPITTAVIESRLAVPPEIELTAPIRPIRTQPRDRADEAGDAVDREQRAVGVDAGEAGGVGIVAGGVDVPAEGGVVEDVPDQRGQKQHQDRAVGQPGAGELDGGAHELEEGCGRLDLLLPDGLALRVPEVERAEDAPGAERDDERRQRRRVTRRPLIRPQASPVTRPRRKAIGTGRPTHRELAHHHRGEDHDRADREVDAGGEDDQGLARSRRCR